MLVALAVALASLVPLTSRSVPRSRAEPDAGTSEVYASPLEVLLSPDGARLYVLCQQSEEVRVLDASSYAVIKNIAVGRVPRGISLSPDGSRLFVTNSWDDTVSVIDTKTLAVVATWPVGAEPSSVVEDPAGKRLFVANRIATMWPCLMRKRARKRSGCWRGADRAIWRSRRMERGFTQRMYIRIRCRAKLDSKIGCRRSRRSR